MKALEFLLILQRYIFGNRLEETIVEIVINGRAYPLSEVEMQYSTNRKNLQLRFHVEQEGGASKCW